MIGRIMTTLSLVGDGVWFKMWMGTTLTRSRLVMVNFSPFEGAMGAEVNIISGRGCENVSR